MHFLCCLNNRYISELFRFLAFISMKYFNLFSQLIQKKKKKLQHGRGIAFRTR